MIYHLKYLKILLAHKWLVFKAAVKLGIIWRGIVHDLSKLLPSEWLPRIEVLRQYDSGKAIFDVALEFDPDKFDDEMKYCWLLHYRRNKHHWQWWVTILDSGRLKVFPMEDKYRKEMLADWIAVSERPDRQDIVPWYEQNKNNMVLNPETREWLEKELEKYR